MEGEIYMDDKYYELTMDEKLRCPIDELKDHFANIKETEASKMFLYIISAINNSYEKIFYKIDDCKVGLFMFESEEIKELFKSVKNTEVSLQAYIKYHICSVEYIVNEDGKDLIIIQSGHEKSTYYNKQCFHLKYEYNSKIVIYDDKNVFVNSTKRFFPANMKSFAYINQFAAEAIIKYYSEKNPFWKDILKDYNNDLYYCPVQFSTIWESKNKKQLIQNKNKKILYNQINKHSILYAYLMGAACKYVDENEFQKLWILSDEDVKGCTSVDQLFAVFYYNKLKNYCEIDDEYKDYIEDYCHMVVKMRKKFNLKMTSINKLIDEHDLLSIIYMSKSVKRIKIPKNSPFFKLKLPEEYKLIKTKKELVQEAILNKNCVATYDTKINRGKCAIYSIIYLGKRYTIEITYVNNRGRYSFHINQLYGKKNSIAPKELHEELRGLIRNENIRLRKE